MNIVKMLLVSREKFALFEKYVGSWVKDLNNNYWQIFVHNRFPNDICAIKGINGEAVLIRRRKENEEPTLWKLQTLPKKQQGLW